LVIDQMSLFFGYLHSAAPLKVDQKTPPFER